MTVSFSGPPDIGLYKSIASFDLSTLISIFSNSDSMFRMPNTQLRLIIFAISVLLLVSVPLITIKKSANNILPDNKILLIIFMFFASYLASKNIYNIMALFLLILSIFYYIFIFKDSLEKYEIFFLSSYIFVFLYPIFQSLLIPAEFSEVDNYLRFLFAAPIYIMMRNISISKTTVLYSINIISIFIGIATLYYLIFFSENRVRGFTSTSAIFSNISLLFFLISFFTLKDFYLTHKKHIYIPILGTIFAYAAWISTEPRGSLIAVLFVLIFILINKELRNKYIISNLKFIIIPLFIFSSIFYYSNSMTRINNGYASTYNYIYDNTPHYWKHKDSIVPRLNLWHASINMINDNIMLGVGLSNYNKSLDSQIKAGKIQPIRNDRNNYTAGMNHAHNQYLDIFAKTGIIGFLTLIYFIGMNYYHFYRNLKNNEDNIPGFMGALTLVSYASYMMYHTILSHQQSALFLTFTLAILAGLSYSKNIERN